MVRRIAAVSVFICVLAAPLAAQKVEVSVSGGYALSEGVNVSDRVILGALYNAAEVKSSSSINFTGGVFVTPQALVEFIYGRQFSTLLAEGPGVKTDVSKLNIDTYHVNFVYHWLLADEKVQPFAFGGLGATHYGFGDFLLPALAGNQVDGQTQFSTTWGAGVKFFFSRMIGAKFTARWTPTYIKSDPAGYWCDPFYGCWVLGDADYSQQFDLSGGITIRF